MYYRTSAIRLRSRVAESGLGYLFFACHVSIFIRAQISQIVPIHIKLRPVVVCIGYGIGSWCTTDGRSVIAPHGTGTPRIWLTSHARLVLAVSRVQYLTNLVTGYWQVLTVTGPAIRGAGTNADIILSNILFTSSVVILKTSQFAGLFAVGKIVCPKFYVSEKNRRKFMKQALCEKISLGNILIMLENAPNELVVWYTKIKKSFDWECLHYQMASFHN